MRILGISAFYHDSAAALVRDGVIVAAAQEERFTRKKHDADFPGHAIQFCLDQEGVTLNDIDFVAFYDKPFLKFERLLESYLTFAPKGFKSFLAAMPIWIKEKLFQKKLMIDLLSGLGGTPFAEERLLFLEHHQSHAASAFYPSPFPSALVLTMDGVGEWTTTSAAIGDGHRLEIFKEIHFPHSLGLLYSAFTYYTGFRVNSGEYKVMGLAPYGEPRYVPHILEHLIDLKADGSFRLNLDYFDYCTGLTMTNARFAALFGGPPRSPEDPLEQRHMDLATSVQVVIEEAMLRLTRALGHETGQKNLCLAGGVALNCVANGKILRDGQFDDIWIQPASGDAGGALGAALGAYYGYQGKPRSVQGKTDAMQGSYLGPEFSQSAIEQRLTSEGATFTTLNDADLLEASVTALEAGQALGWFQGRMEFGPRALGNRSILGDPRSPSMQKTLNIKVKFRESFRPFAPSILREDVNEWFDLQGDSPYMLLVDTVAESRRLPQPDAAHKLFGIDKLKLPRSTIPAVTHVDYSARIQTVHRETNPRYHALLSRFKARTGCPLLVNTSFNVRGEPIVCTPEEAFQRFMRTNIETLVVGNCFLRKEEQKPSTVPPHREQFAPD
ncbi:MAG: carbamoyltransferase [Magnetococcales bacterium]|nr:carbamoyltransferase [Magnetococcales bacterium]